MAGKIEKNGGKTETIWNFTKEQWIWYDFSWWFGTIYLPNSSTTSKLDERVTSHK